MTEGATIFVLVLFAFVGWALYFDERSLRQFVEKDREKYFDMWLKHAPYTALKVNTGDAPKRKPPRTKRRMR